MNDTGVDAELDSSVGPVFLPLKACSKKRKARDEAQDYGGFQGFRGAEDSIKVLNVKGEFLLLKFKMLFCISLSCFCCSEYIYIFFYRHCCLFGNCSCSFSIFGCILIPWGYLYLILGPKWLNGFSLVEKPS